MGAQPCKPSQNFGIAGGNSCEFRYRNMTRAVVMGKVRTIRRSVKPREGSDFFRFRLLISPPVRAQSFRGPTLAKTPLLCLYYRGCCGFLKGSRTTHHEVLKMAI